MPIGSNPEMPKTAIPCARFAAGTRSAMYVQNAVIVTAWPIP